MAITADDILTALIAASDDMIWASELSLLSGGRRADFWTLEPAASQGFRASAYEIKISRGDYLRDAGGKQDAALRFADRFWYVTPPGLLSKADLPDWAGLKEWDGDKMSVIRRAPMRQKESPTWEFVVSLLRNSREARRDVGLLKAQIVFYEMRARRDKQEQACRKKMFMNRLMKKADRRKATPDIQQHRRG